VAYGTVLALLLLAATGCSGDSASADGPVRYDASTCNPTCTLPASGCASCEVQTGGHKYQLNCGIASAPTCDCVRDDVTEGHVTVTHDQCFSPTLLAEAYPQCGFPCRSLARLSAGARSTP
jgi:hypothetical protein